jgi:hypothetical protein
MRWPDHGRTSTTLCLVALALLPFALFWRVTLLQGVFASGDLYDYNFPLLREIARQWRAGQLPLWNPYLYGGTPLHGNMQGGAFYPPNLVLLVLPDLVAYHYGILLSYSLTGVFTFLYLRALARSHAAALLGAVAFTFSGFAMGTLGHVGTLRALPWLPLILFALEQWRRTGRSGAVALLAAAVALMLLAGHPQVPLYALLISGAYTVTLARAEEPGARARYLRGAAVGFALGAGLAAVQIVPTLRLAAHEYLRPHDRSFDYFTLFSLPPPVLANLVFARILRANEAEHAVYAGLATLVLALLAAWRRDHEPHRSFFVLLAIVALVLAFGDFTPLAYVTFHVPGYNLFTSPARNLFGFHFALAVLAAFGLDALRDPRAARPLRLRVVGAFVLLVVVGMGLMASLRGLGPGLPPTLAAVDEVGWGHPAVARQMPLLVATLGLVLFFPTSPRPRAVASSALLLLLLFDLYRYGKEIYPLQAPTVFTWVPPVVPFLRSRPAPARIFTVEQAVPREERTAILFPNAHALFDVESINGFDSVMLRQVEMASGGVMPTYGMVSGSARYNARQFQRFMDLLGTRHVLAPMSQSVDLAPPRYRPVYEDAHVRVFENTEALPRLWLVPEVRPVTRAQAIDVLRTGLWDGKSFDPRQVALVEGGDDATPPPSTRVPAAASRIEVRESRAARLDLTVQSEDGGLLIHSANYSEGWRARVDGSPRPVHRVDGVVQGVGVPPGRHDVVFEYLPPAFTWGAAVSVLSGLLTAVVGRGRWPWTAAAG